MLEGMRKGPWQKETPCGKQKTSTITVFNDYYVKPSCDVFLDYNLALMISNSVPRVQSSYGFKPSTPFILFCTYFLTKP